MYMSLTHFIDYDRPQLSSLNYIEKVDYLEKRLEKILIKPLEEMLNRIKYDKKDHTPVVIFATTICISIEAMGKFLDGNIKEESNKVFKKFISKYMHSDFISQTFDGRLYVDILWSDFRNGLAHCFYIKNGGIEIFSGEFRQYNDKGMHMLEIEPEFLLNDFKNGVNKYLSDLKKSNQNDAIAINFMKIFQDLYVDGK